MSWNTLFMILEDIFYPVIILFLLLGLLRLFVGIRQLHKGSYGERPIPWYNFPAILQGLGAILLALFYGFFVTGIHIPNFFMKILIDVVALICGGLFLWCVIRAYRYAALLPPKPLQRKKAQPKD